jgi:hypothetical protein
MAQNGPKQPELYECGVFATMALEELSRAYPEQGASSWKWGREDDARLRRLMVLELTQGELRPRSLSVVGASAWPSDMVHYGRLVTSMETIRIGPKHWVRTA